MSVLEKVYLSSDELPSNTGYSKTATYYRVHSIRAGKNNLSSYSELSGIESLCSECKGNKVNIKNLLAVNVARNHIVSTKLTRARLFQSQIGE